MRRHRSSDEWLAASMWGHRRKRITSHSPRRPCPRFRNRPWILGVRNRARQSFFQKSIELSLASLARKASGEQRPARIAAGEMIERARPRWTQDLRRNRFPRSHDLLQTDLLRTHRVDQLFEIVRGEAVRARVGGIFHPPEIVLQYRFS